MGKATTKSLLDHRKANKQAQIKQKRTESKLKRLKQISVHVKLLQDEKRQLQEENEKLRENIRIVKANIDSNDNERPSYMNPQVVKIRYDSGSTSDANIVKDRDSSG